MERRRGLFIGEIHVFYLLSLHVFIVIDAKEETYHTECFFEKFLVGADPTVSMALSIYFSVFGDRHYATLCFIFCVDSCESELGIIDLIQVRAVPPSLKRAGDVICINRNLKGCWVVLPHGFLFS